MTIAERTQNTRLHILQSSVLTHIKCDGNFNNSLVEIVSRICQLTELLKSVNIWRRCGHEFNGTFMCTTVYVFDGL